MTTQVNNLLNFIATELKTTDRNTCVNFLMTYLVKDMGMSFEQAADTVFGKGSGEKMTSQMYAILKGQ